MSSNLTPLFLFQIIGESHVWPVNTLTGVKLNVFSQGGSDLGRECQQNQLLFNSSETVLIAWMGEKHSWLLCRPFQGLCLCFSRHPHPENCISWNNWHPGNKNLNINYIKGGQQITEIQNQINGITISDQWKYKVRCRKARYFGPYLFQLTSMILNSCFLKII